MKGGALKTMPMPVDRNRLRTLIASAASCCVLFLAAAAHSRGQRDDPVIQAIAPMSVCQGCVMEIVGFRLADKDTNGTRLLLLRDQHTIAVAVRSFSRSLDEPLAGRLETLTFGVPSNAMSGPWQLIVERDGRRSAPATVHVVDWMPPSLDALSPGEGAPGQNVSLTGTNLPPQLSIDLFDQSGRRLSRIDTAASPQEAGFAIPVGIPEGNLLVRISGYRDGVEFHSQTLPLKVNAVPNVSIDVNMMAPVAPGQWTMLVMDGMSQQVAAERLDVEFRQGQAVTVSNHNWDQNIRIRVPPTLAPGPVSLRARVWRAGRWSPWSPTAEFDLLTSPAEAVIHAIAVFRDGSPFAWWSRVDASPSLEVRAGDRLLVGGEFPFAASRVRLAAQSSPNESIRLRTIKDRGDEIEVEVPPLAEGA